jgi:hypothetical protein
MMDGNAGILHMTSEVGSNVILSAAKNLSSIQPEGKSKEGFFAALE